MKEGYGLNSSGIYSLAGFAYQIKVFVYYLSQLREGYSIGYETYDDVSLHKSDKNISQQEDKLKTYNEIFNSDLGITALQVKQTKLSADDYEKVLFNWIILNNEYDEIEKYVLVVDKAYGNIDGVFPSDYKALFDKIIRTDKSNKALIAKVKKIVNGDYTLFCEICNTIKEKYEFKELETIDNEIYNAFKDLFNYGGVMDTVYRLRIRELVNYFSNEILLSIVERDAYKCDFSTFRHKIDEIHISISDEKYNPASYSEFSRASSIDINNKDIIASRQYVQLSKCKLPITSIRDYLIKEEYYSSYKIRNLENLKKSLIDDIEITTYDNFTMAKADLQFQGNDIPYKRLTETINRENSYTENMQLRHGSAIHLTKEDTEPQKMISWED